MRMDNLMLVLGLVYQACGLLWMLSFIWLFLRPAVGLRGFAWRDIMMGIGLVINIGAIAAVPMLCGIRLHPLVLVGLGLVAFHAWMRFWVRSARRSVER